MRCAVVVPSDAINTSVVIATKPDAAAAAAAVAAAPAWEGGDAKDRWRQIGYFRGVPRLFVLGRLTILIPEVGYFRHRLHAIFG